jgi:ABC-2 type transport system permease protein
VLIVYLILAGVFEVSNIYWLIPAILMHLMLCIGICCVCSVSNVFFRDTQHIIGIGSLAWFFMSPVFYRITMQTNAIVSIFGVNELSQLKGIVFLNPMTGILGAYRAGLMQNQLPVPEGVSPLWILVSAGVCFLVFVAGLIAIRKGDKSFGDVL